MITDQGRWDDRDYYDEHFYDIIKEFVSYGKRYRREMGAEQIMPLSTAIDIVESMFFKEIAERYFDSSNIKDKTAAADEVLRIYEILTVHQKRLVLQKILKKEDND